MYWLIDESKAFIYKSAPPACWKIAVVGGAALPYSGRKKWLAEHKWIGKGKDYQDEQEICALLSDMIECKVEGVIVIGDIGHSSTLDAEQLRTDLIAPLYAFADKEPAPRKAVLHSHFDNLLGKGEHQFSLQEFYKVWNILEVITSLIIMLLSNLKNTRAIDLRKLKLIIDDQCKASLKTLSEFVHFFLWSRSLDGRFSYPPGTESKIRQHLRTVGDSTFLNTNSLIDEILLGEHGAKMDDKYPELKIADLLSNFSRRALEGNLSFKVAQKLNKILKIKIPLHANSLRPEIFVSIPLQARQAVNLLIE